MARPSKLTPEIQAQICAHIVTGNFRDVAAKACGISVRTLRDWLARGRRGEDPYSLFLHAVLSSEAKAELECVAILRAQARGDAKHAAWWLERKFPERWGRERREIVAMKRQIAELERLVGGSGTKAPEAPAESAKTCGGDSVGSGGSLPE